MIEVSTSALPTANGTELDTICRSIADVVGVAGLPLRLTIRLGAACVEVEWPRQHADGLAAATPTVPDDTEPGTHDVCAPLVGTFYRAPEPGVSPFVAVGDTVHAGQQIAIVEAMKLMNAVEAEVAGRVVAILVGDGAAVEYGQPLVRIAIDGDSGR